MKKSTLLLAAGLCLGMIGFAQVPYLQNFEGTNPPTGWALTNTDGTGWTFGIASAVSSSGFAPPAHTTFAIMNSDALGSGSPTCNDTIKTAAITGITSGAWLSFDYYFLGATTSVANTPEDFNVNVSTDGGVTWTQLADVPAVTTNAWATVHYDLSAYNGQSINLAFVYNSQDSWEYGAALDNIAIVVPPTNSMKYTSINPVAGSPASYVLAPNNISISGVVSNLGLSTITTYTVKYTDGSSVISNVKTANIATYANGTFTITTPYNVTLGAHNIKSWIEYTNDISHADDTLKTVLTGASFLPTHQLVMEEGTGCWCGFCPRGAVFMDSLHKAHPTDVSFIAVHDKTSGTDPMAITLYNDSLVKLPGFSGFPSVVVDRKEIIDPANIFTGYSTHNPDFGFADLTLNAVITNSVMAVTTTTRPAIDLNGAYQLALVVTEDSVHSSTSTYAQHNYYSGAAATYGVLIGAGHNWNTATNPVSASLMWFDHVARSITGGFWGQPSSLPASMTSGSTYNYTFSNIALSTWKQNQLTAILLLIDANSGIVLNSKSMKPTITVGIEKITSNINAVNVYPNPSNNYFNVDIDLEKSQKTTVSLYNLMGQVVFTKSYDFNSGENLINISADQLASGMYTLSVATESGVNQTKISVVK